MTQTTEKQSTDLYVDQGCDFEQSFDIDSPANYTYYGAIKRHVESDILYEFAIVQTESGITISIPATVTEQFIAERTYIYELMKKSIVDSKVTMVADGNVIVSAGIPFMNSETPEQVIYDGGTF